MLRAWPERLVPEPMQERISPGEGHRLAETFLDAIPDQRPVPGREAGVVGPPVEPPGDFGLLLGREHPGLTGLGPINEPFGAARVITADPFLHGPRAGAQVVGDLLGGSAADGQQDGTVPVGQPGNLRLADQRL